MRIFFVWLYEATLNCPLYTERKIFRNSAFVVLERVSYTPSNSLDTFTARIFPSKQEYYSPYLTCLIDYIGSIMMKIWAVASLESTAFQLCAEDADY